MSVYQLLETDVNLIQAHLKAGLPTAINNVRLFRNDSKVTLEIPQEYFIFEQPAHVYRPPAIFILFKQTDIRNSQQNANHINALFTGTIALVSQDRIETNLTIKCWRYQCALMELLHEVTLTSSDNQVRLFSRVQSIKESGTINVKDKVSPENAFRKEISLQVQVEHVENLE